MKTPSNLVDYQVNYPVTYANQKRDINVQAAANSSSEVLGYLQNEAQVQVYEKRATPAGQPFILTVRKLMCLQNT